MYIGITLPYISRVYNTSPIPYIYIKYMHVSIEAGQKCVKIGMFARFYFCSSEDIFTITFYTILET